MTPRQIAVLDAGSVSMRELCTRLRRLGYAVLPSKTPDQTERLLRTRGTGVAAAVIPVDLPAFDLRAALRFLRRLAPSRDLMFVAAGHRPDREGRKALRGAGVELALWEPIDDHALRFQMNRALAGPEVVLGHRSSLRAPADWPVAVWSGGRRKPARVYSLSANGAYLATWRPSLPGATLRIDLPVPSGAVQVQARTIMTNVPGTFLRNSLPVGMGVRFEMVTPDVESSLMAWANDRLDVLGF